MLRASISTFDGTLSPQPLVTGVGETGVDHDGALLAFVDAVVLRDDDELGPAREWIDIALGPDAADRAAMVAGNFSMMNRALDAIGAPVDRGLESIAEEMGLEIPAHLAPTPHPR